MKENIRVIVIDFFKKKYPYLDTRLGTGIRDLLIEPLVDYIDSLYQEYGNLKENNIFTAEEILSNLGIDRKVGYLAYGLVKITLKDKSTLYIPEDTKFISSTGLTYKPISDISVGIEDLKYNILEDSYYTVIPIISTDYGEAYNLPKGASLQIEAINPNIYSVEAYSDIIGGQSNETDGEYYARAKDVLTIRNFVSAKSIETVLLNNFDFVYKAKAIGHGDQEMVRDRVLLSNGEIYNLGGKVDVYVKTSDLFLKKVVKTLPDGTIPDVTGVIFVASTDGALIPLTTAVTGRPFSTDTVIKVGSAYANKDVIVYYVPFLDYLQKYFEMSSNKVLSYDTLVRSFYPAIVDLDITIDGDELPNAKDIESILKMYLRQTELFKISDIVNLLYDLGANYVQQPLAAKISLIKGVNQVESFSVYDILNYSDDLFPEITNRTISYFPGNIRINVLSTGDIYEVTSGIDVDYAYIYSTAGSREAYIYWGLKAHPEIIDIEVTSPNPGDVNVYVLQKGKLPTEQVVLDAVENILSSEKIRPLTDNVIVQSVNAFNYNLDITYYVQKAYKDSVQDIEYQVNGKIQEYIEWQKSKIGRDLNPSVLVDMVMSIPGVHLVEYAYKDSSNNIITSFNNSVSLDSVAVVNNLNITRSPTFGEIH